MKRVRFLVQSSLYVVGLIIASVAIFPTNAYAFTGIGAGTVQNPYRVATCNDLQAIEEDLDAHYAQTGNIDCSDTENWNGGVGFLPIGEGSANFSGTYDGQNFTINDIVINEDGVEEVGLFLNPDGATIENIHLRGGYIDSDAPGYSGTLAARAYDTTFSNCSSTTEVRSVSQAGLVGAFLGGSMSRCWYEGDIDANDDAYTAGLVAVATDVDFTDVYTRGTLNGETYSGGLIGSIAGGSLTNAYSSMNVTSAADVYSGGLTGSMSREFGGANLTVTDVFFAGSFTETASFAGSITGPISFTDFSGVYYDQDACGCADDIGNGSPSSGSVTAVNTDGSDPNYFKGNNTNEPMASWDFDAVWQVNEGDYPTLRITSDPQFSNDDFNDDDIPDDVQDNLSSYINPLTDKRVVIDVGENCEITTDDFTAESNLGAQDDAWDYENGLFDFAGDCGAPGFTTTVSLHYYGVSSDDATVRKYNPNTNEYSEIDVDVIDEITISGQPVTVVRYDITDGGELDMDGAVDGVFEDPAGLATPASTDANGDGETLADTGQNQTLIALFAMGLIATALCVIRFGLHRNEKSNI